MLYTCILSLGGHSIKCLGFFTFHYQLNNSQVRHCVRYSLMCYLLNSSQSWVGDITSQRTCHIHEGGIITMQAHSIQIQLNPIRYLKITSIVEKCLCKFLNQIVTASPLHHFFLNFFFWKPSKSIQSTPAPGGNLVKCCRLLKTKRHDEMIWPKLIARNKSKLIPKALWHWNADVTYIWRPSILLSPQKAGGTSVLCQF